MYNACILKYFMDSIWLQWYITFCRHFFSHMDSYLFCYQICSSWLLCHTIIISTFWAMMVRLIYLWLLTLYDLKEKVGLKQLLRHPPHGSACYKIIQIPKFNDMVNGKYLLILHYNAVLPFLEKTTFFLYPIGIVLILSPICKYQILFLQN